MRALESILYLFLVSIPLGTRVLIFDFAPAAGEYGRVFLYLSDILLILFLVVFYAKVGGIYWQKPYSLIIFLGSASLSVFWAASFGLAVYSLARLLLLVMAALAVAKLLKIGAAKIEKILAALAISAVLQSGLGVAQFVGQSDLGLQRLGEAVIAPDISGVAKIVVGGEKIVRAYGTLPHPNILAAFLLLGLLALCYLWLRNEKSLRLYETIGIFAVLLGLTLTFSRTAWGIAVLGILAIAIWKKSWRLLIAVVLCGAAVFSVLQPQILSRLALSADEPAAALRATYNKIGLEIAKNNLLGVGIGNQVEYSIKNLVYQKFGLDQPWQHQPTHNLYLLMAAEIGLLGFGAFLFFILNSGVWNLFRISTILLAALLLFGLTDHFLWTSQTGQLALWMVIGLVLGSKDGAGYLN